MRQEIAYSWAISCFFADVVGDITVENSGYLGVMLISYFDCLVS